MNPISNLILYNCKLDRTMHKTVDFSSRSARDSYFSNSNAIATIVSVPYSGDAYFIRENKTIKVPINADVLDSNGVNYCRFNNPQSGTSQYFYCFIDDIEYVAPNTSALHLRTDVMLTNMGNFTASECFVEREHIPKSDDVFYNQLTPESVDFGDIVEYGSETMTPLMTSSGLGDVSPLFNNYFAMACTTEKCPTSPDIPNQYIDLEYGGVPNTCIYYALWIDQVFDFVNLYNDAGKSDSIISIYLAPSAYINRMILDDTFMINGRPLNIAFDRSEGYTYTHYRLTQTLNNGYTPRNSKLFCYPYNYCVLHNNSGSSIDLKYENSVNHDSISIWSFCAPCVNPSIIAVPKDYENYGGATYYTGYAGNYKYSIEYNDFPEIAYNTDIYKEYIALNKNVLQTTKDQINENFFTNAVNATASGNMLGLISTGVNYVQQMENYRAPLEDLKNRPKQIHGRPSVNAAFMSNAVGIFLDRVACKPQFAEKIDKYFDMYGYNISTVKVPAWNTRNHYNYAKTSGVDIFGTIAKNDKETIASIFNSGVTFWHISGGGVYGTYDTNNE